MIYRYAVCVLSALVVLSLMLSGSATAAPVPSVHAAKKQPARKAAHASHGSRHYSRHFTGRAALIPPPPAYMPSILPEIAAGRTAATTDDTEESEKPENPYVKYVQTPGGNAPQPLTTRKGVTYWAQRS